MATTAPRTVLVAEDHDDTRDFFAFVLEAAGYRVLTAPDGREALEMAQAHLPQAILMDLSMPVMDGLESSERIRRNPLLHQVPIIACTATPERSPRGLFTLTLAKPVEARDLVRAVDSVLPSGDP